MAKFQVSFSKKFDKMLKKLSLADRHAVADVIVLLAEGEPLAARYCDHKLQGDRRGFRALHVRPDLSIVYKKDKQKLLIYCTEVGNHGKLYG